jgi:hypothetical protein
MKTPKVNKTKAEVAAQKADVERQKALVRAIWPFIAEGLTVYDAQTVTNAVGGFIKYEIERRNADLKVSDLVIDVSNEKDTSIKVAMEKILDLVKDEKAADLAQLLERLGKNLGMYSAHVFMKQNMSVLKVEDIVA